MQGLELKQREEGVHVWAGIPGMSPNMVLVTKYRGHLQKGMAQDEVLESKHSEEVQVPHCGQGLRCGDSDRRLVKYMEIDFKIQYMENNGSQNSHCLFAEHGNRNKHIWFPNIGV